jgi:protoheme IX farnesyltransferase
MWAVFRDLCKLPVALASTLGCAAAFALAHGGLPVTAAAACAGVFLTACGACALNQYQEWDRDALMLRTRGRPIPAGRLSQARALACALSLIAAGILTLLVGSGMTAVGLGLAAVGWYNGLYTWLKRRTAFAAVPGAAVGAIPAAIGWVSAGAALTDARLAAIAFFFFVWQVPHFWLLALAHADDYRRAGFPHATAALRPEQLLRVISVWMAVAGLACLLFPVFSVVTSRAALTLLVASALWLGWTAAGLMKNGAAEGACRAAFVSINRFAWGVVTLVLLDPYLFKLG